MIPVMPKSVALAPRSALRNHVGKLRRNALDFFNGSFSIYIFPEIKSAIVAFGKTVVHAVPFTAFT
tara:strand:+ start:351 stop:548 length:198 start_codon:yes stop_codon:yes gene_type:complete